MPSPLHTAAPAKAMLAHASDDTRTALICQIKFHKFTRHPSPRRT
jgi:DNA-binding IclR family transcriptional regulator